jgi:RNA polymerase sigma factor (sigma-70 family)
LTNIGFDSFYRKRFNELVILLVAMGASRADAEDATQEAMVLAWKKWNSIHEPAAWVRTVAVRRWWSLVRTGRYAVPLDGSVSEPAVESDLGIFAEKQHVLNLFRRLPPKQRMVVGLYYDGASCKEIAELLTMSPATVRSNLRHAREALMNDLKEVIASEFQ